jgi:ABC-type methionine transport system ATPase subunit
VFQSAGLLARLTAAENVALPLRFFDIPHRERVRRVGELLERVGMRHRANHYPAQLSGGQQQRVGLARGLVLGPSVLLADEPTSGLDPGSTASILELLSELRTELEVAVVLITHEMDVVRTVADTVAQLDHGKIVERGAVAEVVSRSNSALSRALLPAPPAAAGAGAETWQVRYEGTRVDPRWLSAIGRELGADVALLSGLIETVGGQTAGRATLRIETAAPDGEISAAFRRHGLHATRRADEQPAASGLAGAPDPLAAPADLDGAPAADPDGSPAAEPALVRSAA